MSWKEEIKKDFPFDWDKEMKNIFDKLQELHRATDKRTLTRWGSMDLKENFDSITDSLHELEYWYESVKEKLE